MDIYFSDVFGVSEKLIEEYGAFNISLITDNWGQVLHYYIYPFYDFVDPAMRLIEERWGSRKMGVRSCFLHKTKIGKDGGSRA